MGTGFWVAQVILVVAAIATGIYAERRNRAERYLPPPSAPRIRVPVEPSEVRVGAPRFTAGEQSRLLVLRRLVQQARTFKTDLFDDLQADASTVDAPDASAPSQARSWRTLALWLGFLLILVGGAGVWQANADMARLEREARGAVASASLVSHLLPGVIANPGKYLAAVNSASGAVSGGRDPIRVLAWLDQKEALDRFEAVVGVGVVCVLAATAGWPGAPPRGWVAGDEQRL